MCSVRLRVLVLVTLMLTLAACASSQTSGPPRTTVPSTTTTAPLNGDVISTTAVDLSATPTDWVPVADGDVQISVPTTWRVLYHSSCPIGSPPGEVLVNPKFVVCPSEGPGGVQGPKNVVWMNLLAGLGSVYNHRIIVNGFSVDDDLPTYFVPSLSLQVTLSGPLAQRVLRTLSRSPRTVALASGPAPPVPSSWRPVTFAGLRFSVPSRWRIYRTTRSVGLGGTCGTTGVALAGGVVTLTTDAARGPSDCRVPVGLPYPFEPANGIQLDSGLSTLTLATSYSCGRFHDLTECFANSPDYSILVVKVAVPGHSKPVYVSIGLAGNGMTARSILYSVRQMA